MLIRSEDIVDGIDAAEKRIRRQKLRSLGYHHHVLYEVVRSGSEGSRSSSEIHEQYEEIVDDVYQSRDQTGVSRRRRRDILDKLEEYHLIEATGQNRWRRYQVCDLSVEAPVDIDVGRLLAST
jgi:Cdc6-like AAA superfamily ATPase